MYKYLRKKLALSISELEMPENYQISKWLNQPKHNEEEIGTIISYVEAALEINYDIEPVEVENELPDLIIEKPELTTFDSLLLEKQKTDFVLFGFGKTEVTQIKYAVIDEPENSLMDETIKVNDENLTEVDLPYLRELPKLFRAEASFELPELDEIELLKPSSKTEAVELLHPTSDTYNIELLEPSSEIENVELLYPSSETENIELFKSLPITKEIEFTDFRSSTANVVFEKRETETIDIGYSFSEVIMGQIDFEYEVTSISSVLFKYELEDSIEIDFKPKEPEIIDHLSRLIPEIYKIDLLSLDDISPAQILNDEFQKDYEILDKPPKLLKISDENLLNRETGISDFTKNLSGEESEIIAFTNELFVNTPNTNEFSLSLNEFVSDDTFITEDIIEDSESNTDFKYYKRLIEPSLKIDELLKNKIFSRHYSYQRIGSEFLAECEFALLTDEFALGKTIEAVGAVRLLWSKRTIQSALIITDEIALGDELRSELLGSIDGWIGAVKQFAPELICSVITGPEESEKFKSASNLYITTYDVLKDLLEKGTLSKSVLKSFDCLIYDDIHEHLEDTSNIKEIIAADFEPYYNWLLSSVPEDFIQQQIKNIFGREDLFIFGRSKAIVKNEIPKVVRKDYWLDLDENQKTEYSEKAAKVREELSDILFLGDPFRFQANVFRSLHELQQIYNFASASQSSPKTELLIQHLKMISKWEKKSIVFTQYEKFGANRIEAKLKENDINFVKLTSTMTPDELNSIVEKHEDNDSALVYLCSIKTAGLKFNLPKVSYIINFDQWWNPVSMWSTERKFLASQKGESVTVINYFMKATYDLDLYSYLNINSLNDPNLAGHLTTESFQKLIGENDWTEILKLTAPGDDDSSQVKEQDEKVFSSIEEVTQNISFILTFLGYSINEMETGLQNYSTYIHAKLDDSVNVLVKCVFADFLNSDVVQFHLKDDKFKSHVHKRILVTSGKVDKSFINAAGNVTVIDYEKFKRLTERFGI